MIKTEADGGRRVWIWMQRVALASLVFSLGSAPYSLAAVEIPTEATRTPAGVGDEPHRRAEQETDVRRTSGEVTGVDLTFGALWVREMGPRQGDTAQVNEYRINPRDTVVTDPLDKQYLGLKDLQPGFLVRMEYVTVDGRRFARTITIDSATGIGVRWAMGDVLSLEPQSGILTLSHPVPAGDPPVVTQYVTDPTQTQVADLRNRRFISLADIRPGDAVQVEYVVRGGIRLARLINVEPSRMEFLWSSGRIESIDPVSGILLVSESIPGFRTGGRATYVVDLRETRIVDLSGRRFLLLEDLRPGDPVNLQFTVSNGKRSVQAIILEPLTREGG